MKQLLSRLSSTTPFGVDVGLLIVRLWFGVVLAVAHGIPKFGKLDAMAAGLDGQGFPIPEVMALLATLAETVGGFLIALGLLTRLSAVPVLVTMLVAAFVMHADDPFGKQEFALAYAIPALALLFTGPGRYSLDAVLFRRGQPGLVNG